MAHYLAADTLASAVRRLAQSRAKSSLSDYLIVRRALHLGRSSTVTMSQKDPDFMRALQGFTAVTGVDQPFFSPFGSARDRSKSGFKSSKYESNGASNTVMDWHGKHNSPVERIPDTRPAQVRLAGQPPAQLANFFLINPTAGPRPLALDVACWWFRTTDLEERLGSHPRSDQIIDAALHDLGLSADEAQALFEFDTLVDDQA
jgi:hypothetical protein